jgi:TRAP transporter 4TM/12TM fusion protein
MEAKDGAEDLLKSLGPSEETDLRRTFKGPYGVAITAGAAALSLFVIGSLQFWVLDPIRFQAIVLASILVLGYVLIPGSNRSLARIAPVDILLMSSGVAGCAWVWLHAERVLQFAGAMYDNWDVFFGCLVILSILELTRRSFGAAIPVIAVFFLVYLLLGGYLPASWLGHPGWMFGAAIDGLNSPAGIFGITFSVFVRVVILFMLFSVMFQAAGAGDFFLRLSYAITGRWRGGPAKAAVIASSLFGTISGSAVANVVVTGSFTIPLMKRVGYEPNFAGAVEATASTGGQIMPPIMGAGAFIMAEYLGVSYTTVMIAGFIPAFLYYIGVFSTVDLEALRMGLKGLPRDETPRLWPVLRERWYMLLPLAILLYVLVVAGWSLTRAALGAIVSLVLLSWLHPDTRLGPSKLLQSLADGAKTSLSLGVLLATIGIIIGATTMSGFAVNFSSAVMRLGAGNLFVVLVLIAIVCLILGMGMPTTAAYVIAASVGIPTLAKLGVLPLAAHMFVFYFACISAITPPVCVAVFTGAAIAGGQIGKTAVHAIKLGLSAFIVPFLFVYSPVLIAEGSVGAILQAFVSATIGVLSLSMSLAGISYVGNLRWYWWQRLLFFGAFAGLVDPGWVTDVIGLALLAVGVLSHPDAWKLFRRRKKAVTVSA